MSGEDTSTEPVAKVTLGAIYKVVTDTAVAVAEIKGAFDVLAVQRRADAEAIKDHEGRLRSLEQNLQTNYVTKASARWWVVIASTLAGSVGAAIVGAIVASH